MQESSSSSSRETEEVKTLIWFLRETVMEELDISRTWRRKSFKQRLRLKGRMACCGVTWGITTRSSTISVLDDDNDDLEDVQDQEHAQNLHQLQPIETSQADASPIPPESGGGVDPLPCVSGVRQSSGMNLATALAVERLYRSTTQDQTVTTTPMRDEIVEMGTPLRVSLMKLLEASDGFETEKAGSNENVCCVCMCRKKGSAFIPCGHTFCRGCSREIWLNRGSCPLCNRSILDILDIF